MARFTKSCTSTRLLQAKAMKPSPCKAVLQRSRLINVLKKGSLSNITQASGLITMQADWSSVSSGLKVKPSFVKNMIERLTSWTARFKYIFRVELLAILAAFTCSDSSRNQNSSVPRNFVKKKKGKCYTESSMGRSNRGNSVSV